jgi:hypothetical protein
VQEQERGDEDSPSWNMDSAETANMTNAYDETDVRAGHPISLSDKHHTTQLGPLEACGSKFRIEIHAYKPTNRVTSETMELTENRLQTDALPAFRASAPQ